MTDLQENVIHLGIHKGHVKFAATEIEVDGIAGKRPVTRVYDNYFFSLKEEENDCGELADIGFPYHYEPDLVISEKHFMEHGHVVGIGKTCPDCDERVND